MTSPLDRPVTAAALHAVADAGLLDRPAAAARLTSGPTPAEWLRLADVGLALGGAGLCGAAVIYVVAFNWDELGRFIQFGILAVALVAAGALSIWRFPSVSAKASLFAAFLLTGAFMSLFGQTYQTGVDPWQLFAGWSALTVAWAALADMPLLWAGQVVLWNLALGLWWTQSGVGNPTWSSRWMSVLAGLNVGAWIAAEIAGKLRPALAARWLPRLLLAAGIGFALSGAVFATWADKTGLTVANLTLAGVLAGGLVGGRRDAALWALVGIAVFLETASALSKHLFDGPPLGGDLLSTSGRFAVVGAVLVFEVLALGAALHVAARRQRAAE